MKQEVNKWFQELQTKKQRFLAQLDQLSDEQLRIPEADGKWSLLHVVDHLYIVEKSVLGYCKKKTLNHDACAPANFKTRFRTMMLQAVLKAPVCVKMPKNVQGPSNEISFEETCDSWDQVQNEWEKFLNDFPEVLYDREVFKHPLAGRLTLAGSMEFLVNHFAHHERQINRILKKVNQSQRTG